jgi:hypothetical protein
MKPKLDYQALNLKEETTRPMPTFVVLTGSEKREILDPEIIGPFESTYEAFAWVARLPNANVEPLDSKWPGEIGLEPYSGYAGFAIVNTASSSDPEAYLEERWELYDDNDESRDSDNP